MKSIEAPDIEARALFDALVARRQIAARRRLQEVRDTVVDRYALYETLTDNLAAIPVVDLGEATARALTGNYRLLRGDRTGTYSDLRLRSLVCLMCNERDVATLDHYLPQEAFPEYSVLPLNLVPCCFECNVAKHDRWLDDQGQLLFTHAYTDDVSQNSLLHCEISFQRNVVIFDFDIHGQGIDEELAARVGRHFKELGLARFYASRAEVEALQVSIEVALLLAQNVPADAIASGLGTRAEALKIALGHNHWRPTALRALADSAEFCAGAAMPSRLLERVIGT